MPIDPTSRAPEAPARAPLCHDGSEHALVRAGMILGAVHVSPGGCPFIPLCVVVPDAGRTAAG